MREHWGESQAETCITEIREAIELIVKTPNCGREGFRVRVGDYRIIYTVQGDVLLVVVLALGYRKNIYR